MTQPLIEHRLELAGFSARALELEGDGPPVLLLHGYADSADTWRHVLDRLARRGRRALAVDLPGFAAADPLDPDAPVLAQLDGFTAAAIRHLGEEVVVMGNSLGGCLALRAAGGDEALPLRAIVPVAPAGFDHPAWFRLIQRDPVVRTLLAAPVPIPEAIVRGMVAQAYRNLAFARPRAAAGELVDAFTGHHRTRQQVRSYLDTGARLLPELSNPFRLHRIEVPVLLLWGDRDRMVSHKGSHHLLEAIPETTYELLEGVGHCPQVEAPERVVAALERFESASS